MSLAFCCRVTSHSVEVGGILSSDQMPKSKFSDLAYCYCFHALFAISCESVLKLKSMKWDAESSAVVRSANAMEN